MNKDEYVYLHGLLYEIRTYIEENTNPPPGAFTEYDNQPIRPPQIYKQKEKHKNAITILSTELADAVSQPPMKTNYQKITHE